MPSCPSWFQHLHFITTQDTKVHKGRTSWNCNQALASEKAREKLERETGIEPATSSLGSWRSTAELLPLKGSKSNHNTGVASGICCALIFAALGFSSRFAPEHPLQSQSSIASYCGIHRAWAVKRPLTKQIW